MSSTPSQVAGQPGTGNSRDDARRLVADPGKFFDYSINEMHGIPRARLDELQAHAVSLRFSAQVERIPMVAKLAGNQGIKHVDAVEDLVPVLFEHTMYKSYPVSLLGSRQFDKLTSWLDKLTSVDLSKVDARGCDSIDSWLDLIADTTELDPTTTSGSSGTMSVITRKKTDIELGLRSNRVSELQTFGKPPHGSALDGAYHIIWPTYADGHLMSFRVGNYLKKVYAKGQADHFHPLYPGKGSCDLMWLGAQLRAAAAKGDMSRVNVPPSLLARRAELEAMQASGAQHQINYVGELAKQLRAQKVYCMYPAFPLFQVASRGLERGESCRFHPDSAIITAGGAKGNPMPEDWIEQVCRFFGLERLEQQYGMSEQSAMSKMCAAGRYHFQPWQIPFILDPDTGKAKPRKGLQVGRAAFFDIIIDGHWGGLITGDELEIEFSELCRCGQTTLHMSSNIQRLSAKRGGDDKITCSAAPTAHADALDFLTTYE